VRISDLPAGGATGAAGEEKFRGLLEAAPDAIVIVDERGRIVLVNSQTERLFGYARQEILGQLVEILIPQSFRTHHPKRREGYINEPRTRGMGEGLTLFGLRKDGSEFPVEISLSPLETTEGRLVTAAIRDVTERRRVERDLAEKNVELERANRTKDRFLATMSHELRTPLNAIIGFTGTLLMRLPGPLTGDQEQQLHTVQTSARHLLALINDLLDLAKVESGKLELNVDNLQVERIVEEVAASLGPTARMKGLQLQIACTDPPLWLRTDRRALSQILLNLAANAIKFTPAGRVTIEAAAAPAGTSYRMCLRVSDTGIGIRAADMDRLFQAFEQLDAKGEGRIEGSGLGLHLSHKLATLLGATITVDSEPGAGSTFTVMLPDLS
jgi:protein-histidine pros-kinase